MGAFWTYSWWLIPPALVLFAWIYPKLGNRWLLPIEKAATRLSAKKKLTILMAAVTVVVVRVTILWAMPVPVPAVHDEFAYLLEADTFLHGRLTNPPHPLSTYFETFHVLQHPTYQAIYPPAQGAVLAVGRLLGHPWIGVLLSAALMCAAMTWMLQAWVPAPWALLGGILVLLRIVLFTYWVESYWGGALAATGGALVLGGFRRLVHHRRPLNGFLMGLGLGLLAVSRPLEGAIFCVPVVIALAAWFLSLPGEEIWRTGERLVPPLLLAPCLALIFVGYYNHRVTGHALVFPHVLDQRLYEPLLPFAWQSVPPRHSYANPQFESFYNGWILSEYQQPWLLLSWNKLVDWCRFFVGWILVLPALALICVIRVRRTRLPLVVLLWCCAGLLAVVYFEPHYAAPMSAAFVILLVQAMRHLRQWKLRGRPLGIFFSRLVILMLLARAATFTVEAHRYSWDDWSRSRLRVMKQLESMPGKHVAIVRYAPDHNVHHEWVYNGADIDGAKVVWAREIPGMNMNPLLEYFGDRKAWVVEADLVPPKLENYSSSPQVLLCTSRSDREETLLCFSPTRQSCSHSCRRY